MAYIDDAANNPIQDAAGGVLLDAMTSYYTENLCPNPSFETDLTGWTALTGTTLLQDTTQGFAGHSSMQVETDGTVAGEGVYRPVRHHAVRWHRQHVAVYPRDRRATSPCRRCPADRHHAREHDRHAWRAITSG